MQVQTQSAPVQFVVEALEVRDGRQLKAAKPDEDGYFCKFPIAVLGIPSRNRTFYDVQSVVDQITDPTSPINMTLVDSNLFGEWGHPYMDPKKPDLQRLLTIMEEKQSHHIRKIYTGEHLDNGGIIVYADIKPTGPYKEHLLEQMLDPNINNSFSLRSICSERVDRANKMIYRTVQRLVTFDYVGAGGYAEASKRFIGGNEGFCLNESVDLYPDDFIDQDTGGYAVESITDKDLLKIFGAKEMVVHRKTVGLVVPGNRTFRDLNGNKRSVFHQLNK